VRISDAGLKPAARGSLKTQDAKKSPKIAIWAPSHISLLSPTEHLFYLLFLSTKATCWESSCFLRETNNSTSMVVDSVAHIAHWSTEKPSQYRDIWRNFQLWGSCTHIASSIRVNAVDQGVLLHSKLHHSRCKLTLLYTVSHKKETNSYFCL